MVKVQDTVFEIIKLSKEAGNRHIYKQQIKDELLKTPLAKFENEKYKGDKNTKLDRKLDQALLQLSKNNRIKKGKKSRYSINTSPEKYKPIICRHLEDREEGTYCPVKNCYIADPRAQCELVHCTNYTTFKKSIVSTCPGYTNRNPTETSIKYAKKQIALQNQKTNLSRRYHTPNPRDPVSKFYLPNLEKVED